MTKCTTCGATYQQTLTDGMQYFHRCAPLSAPELAAKVIQGKVTLPLGETADDAVARRIYERAALRDENLPSTDAKDKVKQKAQGGGVTIVPDPIVGPVVVVT